METITRKSLPHLGGAVNKRQLLKHFSDLTWLVRLNNDNACIDSCLQFFGTALGHQCAFIQYRQRMTAFGLIHVMSGNKNGGTFTDKVKQGLPECPAVFRVYRRGWFIQE